MWPSLEPLFSVAAGITTGIMHHFQQPLNVSTGVTPLTISQYAAFVPYVEFARAAYCPPSKIDGWKCGGQCSPHRFCRLSHMAMLDACRAVPGFIPTLTGGDGGHIPYCECRFATVPTRESSLINDSSLCRVLA